jgi:hypothetical protein
MGDKRNAYTILKGKPEGNIPLGRPRCRWVDNIKMDLKEIELGGMDWIDLAQDRDQWMALVNTVMKFRVPQAGKLLSSRTIGDFLSKAQLHEVSYRYTYTNSCQAKLNCFFSVQCNPYITRW